MVTVKLTKEEFYAIQSEKFVEDTFKGSLPAFIAAFASRKNAFFGRDCRNPSDDRRLRQQVICAVSVVLQAESMDQKGQSIFMEAVFLKLLNISITATWLTLAVALLRLVLKKAPRWAQPCADGGWL